MGGYLGGIKFNGPVGDKGKNQTEIVETSFKACPK